MRPGNIFAPLCFYVWTHYASKNRRQNYFREPFMDFLLQFALYVSLPGARGIDY